MRNIRLIVEYEGTNYSGWQVQTALPTVQGALIGAVKALTLEDVKLTGASRTDAGVHAYGQVANFFTSSSISLHGLLYGLNSFLPGDIAVKDVVEAPPGFDARRHSKGKTYVYRILNRRYPSALMSGFAWFVFKPLDVGLMRQGARHFIGEQDFASFMAADSDSEHSVREVTSFEIREKEDGLIELEIKGTAFLRHMVRIMAGTLVALGKGKIQPRDIKRIIEAKDRRAALTTAPPQGLMLMKVDY